MYCVILVTTKDRVEAEKIAEVLVVEKLAACVNILEGVLSVFRWDGKVDKAREALMVIKTTEALFEKVSARVAELHSYESPEVIALPVIHGKKEYLQWIDESVK